MVKLKSIMLENENKKFTHFKLHTQYSICEGAIKIDDLKDYCKSNKTRSIGITDTSNLCGVLEFSETISKQGTKPIIGTLINFKFAGEIGPLTLIAKNETGYKKIVELSSKSYLSNDKSSVIHCQIDELLKNTDGIILMSGTINGLFGKLFNKAKISEIENLYKKFLKIYGENFLIEIQRHNDINEKQFETFNLNISSKLNIPLIASQEAFYISKSMHDAHEALICIGNKSYLNDKSRLSYSSEHYLKSDEEMALLFNDIPSALQNNYNLPYRCNYRPLYSKPILPNLSSDKGLNAERILIDDASKGLKKRFIDKFCKNNELPENNKKFKNYKDRLDHELKIINEMNFSSYFLIVADYIKWAKKNDIPVGPGRGSGAGSLVAWCLLITEVDPLEYNLIFERFLNPARISMPDFDIDFCEEKRDMVFEYLSTKYKDSVAHIITFGKLKARMVVRDVGRVIGLSYGFVDNIAKMIPFDPSRPQTLVECINSEPRLQKLIKEDTRVKRLIDLSLKLEGLNRNVATHAAGVVIADKKLTNTVPLYKDSSSNLLLPSTQFDMYSAENAGLIKFDFLGLKTLTVINKSEKLIQKKNKNFDIQKIRYDDEKVYKLLSSGNTVGLFQLESSGMKEALINMKPTHLEDIIALVALYRPGPMNNIPIYNDCKNGKRKPDYIHPMLEDILRPTYGVIIYQEQIMQIAQKLSGFSAAEADILRKAIGKKKRSEVEKQKMGFIDGAVKNGISKDVAAGIFLKIEPFAEYGFNKSHAAAYAMIAYQTAYLKAHYTNEFFAASMTMDISSQNKLSEFYDELKRLKISIQKPNINLSFADFKSDEQNFYYALGAIKNVGYEAVSNIVKERNNNGKFLSLNDFIKRVNPKDINKLQLEGLVKAGAFDDLCENRASLYKSIPNLILKSKNCYENKATNQIELFDSFEDKDEIILEKENDWEFKDKLNNEFSSLGFYISDHPLNEFEDIRKEFQVMNYQDYVQNEKIKKGNIFGTILKIQERKTNKGLSYAVIKFSDKYNIFELFLFSELLEKFRPILEVGNSLFLKLMKNNINDEKQTQRINIIDIFLINELYKKPISNIEFTVDKLGQLKVISQELKKNGSTNIKIKYKYDDKIMIFNLKNRRNVDRSSLEVLKKYNILSIIG